MDYRKKKHAVYLCTYHMVFVTKYRRPVITDEMGNDLKNYAAYLMQEAGAELISAETDRDHIHLLVSIPPGLPLTEAVRILKTNLAKEAKLYYPDELAKWYHKKDTPFWTPSYFVATTGSVSLEKVKEYVNSQRTKEHQNKYKK